MNGMWISCAFGILHAGFAVVLEFLISYYDTLQGQGKYAIYIYSSLVPFYSTQKVAGKFPANKIPLIVMIETWGLLLTGTCFLCY